MLKNWRALMKRGPAPLASSTAHIMTRKGERLPKKNEYSPRNFLPKTSCADSWDPAQWFAGADT
ncbi:hypothetical protein MFRU_016g00220 [Monilinia fructicola]|nr:hypothetical protein MFRU_016g00220 [Monilinia fructicola]